MCHGDLDEGGHGGDSSVERTVFVVCAELGGEAGGVRENARLVDVAPTVLHRLGIGIDAAWSLDGAPLPVSASAWPLALAARLTVIQPPASARQGQSPLSDGQSTQTVTWPDWPLAVTVIVARPMNGSTSGRTL